MYIRKTSYHELHTTMEEIKKKLTQAFQTIEENTLKKVYKNIESRLCCVTSVTNFVEILSQYTP